MILCANPKAQYLAHREEIDAALRRVIEGGYYILGPEVAAFEREFAEYCGVEHGIGVANGTDALHLALRALGIGPGDEVITTAHTAVATVSAIELAGATPVFADINPATYTLDPVAVEAAVGPATKAIIAVHLYGQPADLDALSDIAKRKNLRLIEDCAQAHGARYRGSRVGSLGDVGCFSCYPTKNLGALGDGGIVVTRSRELAEKIRLLREYGWAERYISHSFGFNSRLDELQAAVLRVKLSHLDADNGKRVALAGFYRRTLADTRTVLPPQIDGTDPVYHLFVIRCPDRDRVQSGLKAAGIGALIHYPMPIHRQPAYAGRIRGGESLPHTEAASREILSLPMYPELSETEAERTVAALKGLLP